MEVFLSILSDPTKKYVLELFQFCPDSPSRPFSDQLRSPFDLLRLPLL